MRTIVLAAMLAGCGGGAAPASGFVQASSAAPPASPPQPSPAQPAQPGPTHQPTKPGFPGAPATPAGEQLAWVLDAIVTRHGKVDLGEIEVHFHSSFLSQVSAEQTRGVFEQMGSGISQLTIASVEGQDDRLIAHVLAGNDKLRISFLLDGETKRIAGLLIQPDVDAGPRPRSFEEASRMITQLAPKAQLLVAALDNGECKPMQELAASHELAIGSSFKLYVLLALADQILTGKSAWTDELAVRDDWKSLPSGLTQEEPAGSKHSLATFAERMISISDNTAADHLLYMLGRETVEAAVRATRHARPALDAPLLSTRELFMLKLGTPPAEVDRYLKLPEARRRDYLDRMLAGKHPDLGRAVEWKAARRIDQIEWFASAEDLCRVMGALWLRAQDPRAAPLLDVLSRNPGLPLDKKLWPYVGYKGGSEPGVFNMTFLLRRQDDKWFVVSLGLNAAEGDALEEARIVNVMSGVIDLLGSAR